MFTMKVDADRAIAKLDARLAAIPRKVDAVVAALGLKLLAAVIQRAPVKTGKLRRSIFAEIPPGAGGGQNVTVKSHEAAQSIARLYVSPDTSYAKFVELGTKPHDIYPSKAQALRFMVGGKEVFARHVHHPETKAYRYLHGPFEEMKPEIVASIKTAVAEAIK